MLGKGLREGNINVESEQNVILPSYKGKNCCPCTRVKWRFVHSRILTTATTTWNALTEVTSEGNITCEGNITGKHCRILPCTWNEITELTSEGNITCDGNITRKHCRILPCTWNEITELTSEGNITCEGNITGKHCRILPCTWNELTEVTWVILPAMVILQGNTAEYYPAHDMLSTNEIFNIAYDY